MHATSVLHNHRFVQIVIRHSLAIKLVKLIIADAAIYYPWINCKHKINPDYAFIYSIVIRIDATFDHVRAWFFLLPKCAKPAVLDHEVYVAFISYLHMNHNVHTSYTVKHSLITYIHMILYSTVFVCVIYFFERSYLLFAKAFRNSI